VPRHTLFNPPHLQTEPWPPAGRGQDLSAERAKEVFRAACAQIGLALETAGFRYYKSKQRCVARLPRFTNEIAFKSSRYNVSGTQVKLRMYATVASAELRAWRAQRLAPELATAHVAGGMVHLLGTRFGFVEWELADPSDREATIADALDFIHSEVLPYFKRFEDIENLLSQLSAAAVPAFDLVPSVEFSYCFGGQLQAQATLDRFVRDRPDLHAQISAEQAAPTPSALMWPANHVQHVVFLRHHYGLQ
jgi:hypothetical protein